MNIRNALLTMLAVLAGFGAFGTEGSGMADEGRPYRAYLVSTARDGQAAPTGPGTAGGSLPALPRNWPSTFELGQSDSPGGAAVTGAKGFGFRYQYLAGGANTGTGWATWEPSGSFVTNYIAESATAGVVPVFSYYMVRQSLPGLNMPEPEGVSSNLSNPATMRALFDDIELFFKRAGERGTPVVFHFEPDLWGYLNQRANSDDASTVEVSVRSAGHPDLADLPDTAAGLAAAVLRLRDLNGTNVLVAYHISFWGGGVDPIYSDPSEADLDRLSGRAVDFYESLGTNFDVTFAEMSDRDAAFKQYIYGDGGASWWDEGDFERHTRFLKNFVAGAGLRVVLWQIPQGNTLMRAMNNTWNHYQDNKVEWLLGDPGRGRLQPYLEAGVIGLFFGRGADGATCACDAAGDGATNPEPINGNSRVSTSADDDGGYFEERREDFVEQGVIALR